MNRVQRTRQAKLPPNTLCVTRPGKYGNPYRVKPKARAVDWFYEYIFQDEQKPLRDEFVAECKRRGIENLACWCALNDVCHADVWLEVWETHE